jgi:hypothetical protein
VSTAPAGAPNARAGRRLAARGPGEDDDLPFEDDDFDDDGDDDDFDDDGDVEPLRV